MDKKKTPIDVNYEELGKVYTIDEVSNKLKIDQSSILFYFEKLNDYLNITSVGAFQLFDDKDIENLEKIKHLHEDLNMTMLEIRKYLKLNQQEILVHKKDATHEISVDVFGQLISKLCNVINEQNQKIDNLSTQLRNTDANIQSILAGQSNIESKVDSISIDSSETKRLALQSQRFRESMLLREENNKQKHSWFYKIFHHNI